MTTAIAPRPILKRPQPENAQTLSIPTSPRLALPFAHCSTASMMLSPHIHFPATPALVQTQGMTYSPATYDRRPIAVSPNDLDLPERGARSYTPETSHEPSCATRSESPMRDSFRAGRRTQRRRNPKGSYFHPRAFEACERECDQEEEEEDASELSSSSSSPPCSPSEVFFSDSSSEDDEQDEDSPPTPMLVVHDPTSSSSSEDNDEVLTPPPAVVPNDPPPITTTFAEAAKNGTGVNLDVLLPSAPPPIPRTRKRSQEELQHALTFLPHPHHNHHNAAFSSSLDSDGTDTPERGRSRTVSPRRSGGAERQSPSSRSRMQQQQQRSASSGSRRRRNAFCSTSISSGSFSATTILGATDNELEASCLGGF